MVSPSSLLDALLIRITVSLHGFFHGDVLSPVPTFARQYPIKSTRIKVKSILDWLLPPAPCSFFSEFPNQESTINVITVGACPVGTTVGKACFSAKIRVGTMDSHLLVLLPA